MTNEFPKAQRPREDLILDIESKQHVKGQIVQFLASHQISGLRFLYKNYKNNRSCFLNDDSGLGKIFQMVAFLGAICSGTGVKVLVMCHDAVKLLHWRFHCSVLLPQVKTVIADDRHLNADVESKNTESCIILSSMANALVKSDELKIIKWRLVVVHDGQLEICCEEWTRLQGLASDGSCKVIVGSADMMANTRYFYEVLKFCECRLPIFVDEANQYIRFVDFNRRFGGADDRSASKRNIIFRQKNLLNVCNDFYLRRSRHQAQGILPLVDAVVYEKSFKEWKTLQGVASESTLDSSWFDDDMEVPATQHTSAAPNVGGGAASPGEIRFDDFETQMSPLIYDSSDSEAEDNACDVTIDMSETESPAQSKCNRTNPKTKDKEISQSEDGGAIKRILRSHARKRNWTESQSKTKKSHDTRRNKKGESKTLNRAEESSSSNSMTTTTATITTARTSRILTRARARQWSDTISWSEETSASDIQVVQEGHMTPITISSSSDSPPNTVTYERGANLNNTIQSAQSSPDIFGSFIEQEQSQPVHAADASSQPSTSPIPAGQSRFAADDSRSICTQDFLVDSQDSADTTNPVDALCTTTSDIFEITKNNVFHNVLQVNDGDKHSDSIRPAKSCFSGVRVILPRLKSDEILELQRGVSQQALSSPNDTSGELIDLTAESQLNTTTGSEDKATDVDADIEKTPQRKRPLTPSTRSCVRRLNDEICISSDDEPTPSNRPRSGWLTKRSSTVTSPHATPRSRKQLEKWFPSHTGRSSGARRSLQSVLQPRNIFDKTNGSNRTTSTTTLESPSIFSSDDE